MPLLTSMSDLGVDPRKANQMVRGVVTLPHGTGKETRCTGALYSRKGIMKLKMLVPTYVGLDDYIEKIEKGWTDVDVIITMPPVMAKVGKLGRVLGPEDSCLIPKVVQ
jgi:large subunit ribosomal protein L1